MLMILARLVRSESFWAVAKVRSPHTGPEPGYPRSLPAVCCRRAALPPTLAVPRRLYTHTHTSCFDGVCVEE